MRVHAHLLLYSQLKSKIKQKNSFYYINKSYYSEVIFTLELTCLLEVTLLLIFAVFFLVTSKSSVDLSSQ